jgi:hypothetical protein
VWVSYYYGFSTETGGGEYQRPARPGIRRPARDWVPREGTNGQALPLIYRVLRKAGEAGGGDGTGDFARFTDALAQWKDDRPLDAVIELADSEVYTAGDIEEIELGDRRLEIRAATGQRPILRLVDRYVGRPDALVVKVGDGGCLDISGLVMSGRGLEIGRDPKAIAEADRSATITISHSTLVPGWSLESDAEPRRPAEPSLTLSNVRVQVRVDSSIIGTIRVIQDQVKAEPVEIGLYDSVLDATRDDLEAVDAPGPQWAHAVLTIARSTVIGKVLAHAIELAENSIFTGAVRVARRQCGCMRFCYVPPGSRTPRRYHCQPDLAVEGLTGEARRFEELRVRPRFNSQRYGTPPYAQLADDSAEEIVRGADDQAEMGAFHDLFQPQREANLRARLEEYVPVGVEVGIIYAS